MTRRWLFPAAALVASFACAQSRDVAVSDSKPLSACTEDCSRASAAPCFRGFCDADTKACKVIPVGDGTACDDGLFCTVGETCRAGVCGNGKPNDCGATECLGAACNENERKCAVTPVPDDTPCAVEANLCIVGAACKSGECSGILKDCTFAPGKDECHVGACDPKTGACQLVPGNDFAPCHAKGPCAIDQTCWRGECQGGQSADAWSSSTDTTACHMKVCSGLDGTFTDKTIPIGQACAFPGPGGSGYACSSGLCGTGGVCNRVINAGAACPSAVDDCSVGVCNTEGRCTGEAANDGALCDPRDTCTVGAKCQKGTCGGTLKSGVSVYFRDDFGGPLKWSTPADAHVAWSTRPARSIELQADGFGSAGSEPERDHTPTLDQMFLDCKGCSAGDAVDSAVIDLSQATGNVWLTMWSVLRHDWSLMAFVSVFDGTKWTPVYSTAFDSASNDYTWRPIVVDVTRYKNAKFQIRVGFAIGDPTFSGPASWFIDDVSLANQPCGSPEATGGGASGGANGGN